jgi:hypothetical protein
MSWVSWLVVTLAGLVSSVSAVVISIVIALVIGQVAVLLYRWVQASRATPQAQ